MVYYKTARKDIFSQAAFWKKHRYYTKDTVSMQKKIKITCIVSLFFAALFAEEVTKVLQNGINGYAGCTDSYLYRVGAIPSSDTMNFGDVEDLKTAN